METEHRLDALMSEAVTVALLGNPEHAFDNGAFTWEEGGAKELRVPWDDLPKVSLEVEASETLYQILHRALRDSRIRLPDYVDPDRPPLAWVLLYTDREAPTPDDFIYEMTLVDDDGRARWAVPYREVTFGQLVRAAEAGTVAGDPRRLYLILLPPQGDGVMATWSVLLEGLRIAQHVLEMMATAGGAIAFGKFVLDQARQRIGNGRQTIQAHYLDWSERGARPDNFAAMLGVGPWHGADLAQLLGCSLDEAQAILWVYGYEQAASGLWRRGESETAQLVGMVNDDVALTQAWNPNSNFELEMVRRAEGLVTTGEALPEPSSEPEPVESAEGDEDDASLTFGLPIEGARVRCECGRDDCTAELEFYRSASFDRIVLSLTPSADHFVIDPMILAVILGALAR
jgi:hypothetical protein